MSTSYRITNFNISKTKKYQNQHVRGYQATANHNQITTLMRQTNNGLNISAGSLLSDDPIMHMSSNIGSEVLVDNGWDTQRNFFVMIAEGVSPLGVYDKYILTGYSSENLINDYNEELNPNGMLYFNNILQLTSERVDNLGTMRWRIKDTDQVLRPTDFDFSVNQYPSVSAGGYVKGATYVRPTDVMGGRFAHYLNEVNNSEAQTHYDVNQQIHQVPISMASTQDAIQFSKQSNAIASKYLERSLNAMGQVRSSDRMEDRMGVDMGQRWVDLQNHTNLQETSLTSQNLLLDILNNPDWRKRGGVSVGGIINSFPEINHPEVKLIIDTPELNSAVYNVEKWHGRDEATVVASTIAAAIPGIMAQCGILSIQFVMSNNTVYHSDTPYDVRIGYAPQGGLDVAYLAPDLPGEILLNEFINRVKNEILPQITKNNSQTIVANIRVELFCDVSIHISVNNGMNEAYLAPTFANGLYSPTVSDAGDVLDLIGETLERIDGTIADTQERMAFSGQAPTPQYQPTPQYNTPQNTTQPQNFDNKNTNLF